jgi:hypothetical protein
VRIIDEFKEMQKRGNEKCARKIAVFYQIFGLTVDGTVKILKSFGADTVFCHYQKSSWDIDINFDLIVHDMTVSKIYRSSKRHKNRRWRFKR